MSFWGKLRDPWYWFFLGVKALPVTQPYAFALILIMIDKRDDFQLINFVMEAKGLQFLTSGCLTLLYYALRLSYCTALASPAAASDCHMIYSGSINSVARAVGVANVVFVTDLCSYVLTVASNIVLPWIAMNLLKHSVPKGVEQRRGDDLVGQIVTWKEKNPETHSDSKLQKNLGLGWDTYTGKVVDFDAATDLHVVALEADARLTKIVGRPRTDAAAAPEPDEPERERRSVRLHRLPYIMRREFGTNHLHKLLIWDVAACAVSAALIVGALFWTSNLREGMAQWLVLGAICWFRIIYSVTTFPFLIFRLPVVSLILSHARPTGYTRTGKCVPRLKTWPWYHSHRPVKPRSPTVVAPPPDPADAPDDAAKIID